VIVTDIVVQLYILGGFVGWSSLFLELLGVYLVRPSVGSDVRGEPCSAEEISRTIL
jgi:hypothetical protein